MAIGYCSGSSDTKYKWPVVSMVSLKWKWSGGIVCGHSSGNGMDSGSGTYSSGSGAGDYGIVVVWVAVVVVFV